MYEDSILLKIKREFTDNEAVQQLLKMVSDMEIEIGMLKSEREEWKDTADKLRNERTMTKKQWLQEEVFLSLSHELEQCKGKKTELKKQMEQWRNKYFSLLATTSTETNMQH